eukprot:scaffold9027_cov61-Attheya_sp.AAC.9
MGQCGINSSIEEIHSFRKCHIAGFGMHSAASKKASSGPPTKKSKLAAAAASADPVEIVQVSCGEQFSVALSSKGHLYSAGSGEFGQLGNGATGEHFVTANKLAFDNATKFERRALFCDQDSGKDVNANTAIVPLPDSSEIVIRSIACGKNHSIALEAPTQPGTAPRLFTWGCGDYGCLGHGKQADEYFPRLISTFSEQKALFLSNAPRKVTAGAQCGMVLTEMGHVYYWGRHRPVGEATMRPTLVDALANNSHVIVSVSGGNQTLVCATKNGSTVAWGNGTHGELGFGPTQKSSSKPIFVEALDMCRVSQVACGYGHTLYLVQHADAEDKAAVSKLKSLECQGLDGFIHATASMASCDADEDDGKKSTKKGRSKKK